MLTSWKRVSERVKVLSVCRSPPCTVPFWESCSLELECKKGGTFHLKLNIELRPIENKYHEGKMKSTLKRELEVPEIAENEENGTSMLCEIVTW